VVGWYESHFSTVNLAFGEKEASSGDGLADDEDEEDDAT
jgi:hypothetical protein